MISKPSSSSNAIGGARADINFTPITRMSDKEFDALRTLIYENIGIEIRPHKRHLLINRLTKRLRHLGIGAFSDYLRFLDESAFSKQELTELIDAVTTNKTDFFREPKHYDVLRDSVIPAIVRESGRSNRTIRLWSSACSSGEEPYTLAICLSEYLREYPGWKFEILASDVSETMLRTAVSGIYEENKIKPVPFDLLRKYFLKGERRYKVDPELARKVTFKKINLKMDYQRMLSGFDIVFCRNVLIYFNNESQRQIIDKHWRVLRPGGFLFLGHSETMHGGGPRFEYVAPSVYRKAPNGE